MLPIGVINLTQGFGLLFQTAPNRYEGELLLASPTKRWEGQHTDFEDRKAANQSPPSCHVADHHEKTSNRSGVVGARGAAGLEERIEA
jgi:hypothetical protein